MAASSKRYPANVALFARRMAESEYTVTEIRAALAKRGHTPSHSTVLCWIDPDYRSVQRDRVRDRMRRIRKTTKTTPGPARPLPWGARLKRMQELREVRVSFSSIARVMNLDYGLSLTADNVRYLLDKPASKSLRRYLVPQEASA